MFLEVEGLCKSYGQGDAHVNVLNGVTTQVEAGSMCVILGPSGSGKSTLLNAIGGLETTDAGAIRVGGQDITGLFPDRLSDYRRDNLGFVFQFYNLIPNLTVRENVAVCRYLSTAPLDVDDLLETLGLAEHARKFPPQLSGGQQQRCAIARALVKNPALLLCDEPTGALDSATAKEILVLLEQVNRTYGTTMLMVTHNEAIANMAHQVIKIKDGRIVEDRIQDAPVPAARIDW